MNHFFTAFVILATAIAPTANAQVDALKLPVSSLSFEWQTSETVFDGWQKDGSQTLQIPSNVDAFEDDFKITQVSDELVIPPAPGAVVLESTSPIVVDEDCCEEDSEEQPISLWALHAEPYTVYRSKREHLTWIPGSGNDFGMVNWANDPYLDRDSSTGLATTINVHWLNGPSVVPLESRVFDFVMTWQHRGSLSPAFSYDLAASAGVYSDFEASARDGVRFPAHAVGMLHFDSGTDLVFGIDYLDRDDISALPVFGLSFHETGVDGLRLDLVFPRPKIQYTFDDEDRVYLAGELGGGSWDVELKGVAHDVVTYRDYRIMLGFESVDDDGTTRSLEFGYVFDRELSFRGPIATTGFGDAFVINWVTNH